MCLPYNFNDVYICCVDWLWKKPKWKELRLKGTHPISNGHYPYRFSLNPFSNDIRFMMHAIRVHCLISLFSNNVPHDFTCRFEVYCHKLHEDLTIASTPKKLRKKINDLSGSVGRSVGKRLSGLVGDHRF